MRPLAVAILTFFISVPAAKAETLNLLIWESYISPKVIADFEAKTGISIHQTYYDSSDKRDEILTAPENRIDLVLVSEDSAGLFGKRGILEKLPDGRIAALPEYPERFRSLCTAYGVPYLWGTMGIVYRTDKIAKPPESWQDLMQPDAALRGHVAMMDDYADGLVPALIVLNQSTNSSEPAILKKAFELMKQQAPFVRSYTYIVSSIQDPVFGKDLYMALAYSGDEKTLNDYAGQPGLWRYALPASGTRAWLDCMAMTSSTPHREEALAFLDYLASAPVAAENAASLDMPPTNPGALPLLPVEMQKEREHLSTATMIENGEFHTEFPSEAVQLRKRIFNTLVNFHDAR